MDSALAPTTPTLDIRTLLARVNQRIALLRAWLSHDHRDEPYWWARRIAASTAQQERAMLRRVADLLHVERATARGRLHGTRFATIDVQRAWLDQQLDRTCPAAAELACVPPYATLALLRDGKLPL
jgi:hypothetical protein